MPCSQHKQVGCGICARLASPYTASQALKRQVAGMPEPRTVAGFQTLRDLDGGLTEFDAKRSAK